RIVVDPDETPEGQQQLRIIEARARDLYREFKIEENKRRPLALERDMVHGYIREAVGARNDCDAEIRKCNAALGNVEGQMGRISSTTQLYRQLSGQRDAIYARR